MATPLEEAVACITKEIFNVSRSVSREQRYPELTADDSDALIANGKKVVEELRKVREQLENINTGILP